MKKLSFTLTFLYLLQNFSAGAATAVDPGFVPELAKSAPLRSYGLTLRGDQYQLPPALEGIRTSVFFHDQTTGKRLGKLNPLENELALFWGSTSLFLDNVSSSFKRMTIHSEGHVEWGTNILPTADIILTSPTFTNRGQFLAHSFFLNSSSSNFGIIDVLGLTVRGAGFQGHAGSTTLGRVRFDVDVSNYSMEGEAASLFQTVKAKNANFMGERPFTGVFWDVEAHRATFGDTSRPILFGGMRIHVKHSLTLKDFDIQNGLDPLGRFFEGSLGSSLTAQNREDLASIMEMGRDQVRGPLRATSGGYLVQTGHIDMIQGDIYLTGKQVNVEGHQRSQSDDSRLKVKATDLVRFISPESLPHVLLQAPQKLLAGQFHIRRLTSKTGIIGIVSKGIIDTWDSFNEEIASDSNDFTVNSMTLTSPQRAAFNYLTTTHLKVQDAQKSVHVGVLTLREDAAIVAPHGQISVTKLMAPDATLKAIGESVTILSTSQAKELDLTARTGALRVRNTVTRALKAHAEEGSVTANTVTYETADLKGQEVFLYGTMKGPNLKAVATRGHVTSLATFDPATSLTIKTASMTSFHSVGPLKHLDLTLDRLNVGEWIRGGSSLSPNTLALHQVSRAPIDLSGQSINLPFPQFSLETPGPLRLPDSHFESRGDVSLAIGSLYAPRSTSDVRGIHTIDVEEDANLDFTKMKAGEFHLKVKKALSAQGVQIRGVRALEVVAKTVKGAALKEHKGNWNYEYDVLTARPEFICENGPLVVLAEEGLWLEVPILRGQSVMFGSLTNDATVIPVTLESAQRWVEEHRKKGGFGRRSKTSSSEHYVRTQTVVQPEIVSQTDLLTQAPQGTLNLHAAKVLVAGSWTVVAQTFGMEAATALQERYSRVSRSSRSGFGVKTSSSTTSLESHEETVPPIMQIGGNLYLYCDDAHFEAIHGFVGGDVLSTARKVTVGAHVVRHHRETHMTSKGPFMEAKSGRVDDSTRSTLSQLDIQGRFQGPEGSTLEITGPIPGIDIQGSKVVPLKPEHSDTSSSYSESKSKNKAALGTITTAVAVIATACGGPVTGTAAGSLTSTVAQDSKFDGGKLVLDMGKSAVIALAVPMVSDAVGVSAPATTFRDHVQQALVEQTVHMGVDIATGEDIQSTLKRGALGVVTQSVGATAANGIAKNYHAGDIGYFTHKGAHALVAAGLGFTTGGTEGAISGGIGAAVAEITVGALPNGKNPSQSSLLIPKLAGIVAGGLIGKDPSAASTAASNALNNNWVFTMMMEAKMEAEAWEYQKRLADEAKEDSPAAADHTQNSSEMRSLFSFIDEMRTKFGLPVNRPFFPTFKSEGKMFLPSPRNVGWTWGSTTKGADHRYESQHSESSPPIGLNIGFSDPMSGYLWTEEVLPLVTEATKERVRALRRWARDTFTSSNEPPTPIETFFEGKERKIMAVHDFYDMPKDWPSLIPQKEVEFIKARARQRNEDIPFDEKLYAFTWITGEQQRLIKEKKEQCDLLLRDGFGMMSMTQKCGSFLALEEVRGLSQREAKNMSHTLSSHSETLGVSERLEKASSFVTEATKEGVGALRRWARNTFTSNELPAPIESFFEGRENRIVTVRDLEDLPKYLGKLIPRKELASIKTQATDSYNRDASGLTFEDHEKLWALAWFADKRTEILKERRDRCEKIGSRGFALASERKKCASFLSFEEVKKLPPETKKTAQGIGDVLASLAETLDVPQWFQESTASSVDYEFIKYFPVGGHVPEPMEHFGKGSQVELPQWVSLFLEDFGQFLKKDLEERIAKGGFERKSREQAQKELFESSQSLRMARYKAVAAAGWFEPAEGESPQPKAKGLYQTDPKDSQRRQSLLAIKSVDDVPEHWKGFVKEEHHADIELICTSAISSGRLSESEQASLRAAENRCARDEAYGFIRKEQEEMKAIGEFPKSTREKSAVASFLKEALKGVKALGEVLPFSSKPAYAETIPTRIPVDEQFRREDLPRPSAADSVNTIGSDVKQTSERGSNFSDLNPTATSLLAATFRGAQGARKASLLKTDNLAAGINAIGSGVEQVSEWWGDFAYQNPTTASFLVETLRGAQYAGETVLVTTCCAASPVVTPGPCAASLAFVASNHSGFTEYAVHQAAEGFTPLLNSVPGVNPVYGANTSKALATGLSFLAAGKLISTVTKIGAPIGYGIPAINRDIVRVFDVNRGRTIPLLAAEEVPASMTNGRPLTVSDQFVLGEYCASLSEAFGSIEKLKLQGRYNTGTEYATALGEAYGSIFKQASEKYDTAIESIHNPSIPKGTIIKVHNEAFKKIKTLVDVDAVTLPLKFKKGQTPLQPLREMGVFGAKTEQGLLNYFGSIEQVSKATVFALERAGMNGQLANHIYLYFRTHGTAEWDRLFPKHPNIIEMNLRDYVSPEISVIEDRFRGSKSPLEPLKKLGVGPKRGQDLFYHFGSVEALSQASLAELTEIVPYAIARTIRDYFQERGTREWTVKKPFGRLSGEIVSVGCHEEAVLRDYFGSIEAISRASVEQLCKVPEITPKIATNVYAYFQENPFETLQFKFKRYPAPLEYLQRKFPDSSFKTHQDLLNHFGSIKAISKASLEELKAVAPRSAHRVYEYFQENSTSDWNMLFPSGNTIETSFKEYSVPQKKYVIDRLALKNSPLKPLRLLSNFGSKSELDLLDHFGSVESLSTASLAELRAVAPRAAPSVYRYFQQNGIREWRTGKSNDPFNHLIVSSYVKVDRFKGTDSPLKPLERISGLGDKTVQDLFHHFGSPEAISKATLEELKAIAPRTAPIVYGYFQEHGIRAWMVERPVLSRISEEIISVNPECEGNLLHYFGSVEAISKANQIDLQRVSGITPEIARDIHQYFHKE